MTGRGSREKGAEFERKIAKAIRGALQLKTVQCFRAPQSGGHRGVSAHAPGDILFAPRIGELMRVSSSARITSKPRSTVSCDRTGTPPATTGGTG